MLTPGTPASAAPAAGFIDSVVLSGLDHPTTVRFSPDGRVFVAEKSGIIKVFDGLGDTTPVVFADLRTEVHNFWDRGLLGLALDPQFPAEPWVYVLYTFDAPIGGEAPRWGTAGATSDVCPTPPGATADGCVVSGHLSRLQAAGNTMTGTEQVLIEDWCQQYPSHSVGDLEFGADGALYASAGDGASFNWSDYGQDGSPTNPCGDPPVGVGGTQAPPTAQGGSLRAQDARTTADPVGLDGTVIRVDPQTGAGLPGNPLFSSTDPNARRIVATGLRNPFRMAAQPGTTQLWVADVGNANWEELDRIATPADATADNFGWPCYEGDGRQASFDAIDLTVCEDLYAQPNAVTPPAFRYAHTDPVVAGEACPTGTSSLSGVEFYQGGAYPDSYDGAMFFADYSRDCIWATPPGGSPQTLVAAADDPVDLEIGPGGDLFYVDHGGGNIHRLSWTAAQPPTGSAYLSDLSWVAAQNGWGPTERDSSNGEALAADGSVIRLNGTTYAKGLGAHARSDIRFDISGNCSRFESDIGIDDEMDYGGSATFEVWGDGTLRFQSGVLTATSPIQSVDLAITGVRELRLVIDGGADVNRDHGDWAAARVTCGADTTPPTVTGRTPADGATGLPVDVDVTATFSEALDTTTVDTQAFTLTPLGDGTPVPATVTYDPGTRTARLDPSQILAPSTTYEARLVTGPDGVADMRGNRLAADERWSFTTASNAAVTTYLSDRTWTSATNGWGPVERDRSNGETASGDGSALRLAGQTYAKGLGAHARSEVVFDLAGNCSRFQSDIGVDDEIDAGGSVTFEVWGDGTRRYQSSVLTATSATQPVDLAITGVQDLRLVVDGGADITRDHGDWAAARVTCGGGTAIDPEVHIDAPLGDVLWSVGDRIDFSGGAVDAAGSPVAASALTWSLLVHHCSTTCHTHTIQQFAGVASGSFLAPDHEYPSYLELQLTATLPGGGSVTDSVELDPRTVPLTFTSQPTGLDIVFGAEHGPTPFSPTVIVGSTNSVSTAATQPLAGTSYDFLSWSDGGARSHDIVAPGTPTTYDARFAPSAPMPFSAYNDLNGRTGDANAARVTRFGFRTTNGTLIDLLTGQAPGPTISGSYAGGLDAKTTGGAQAAGGTDAARHFGTSSARIVDLGRSIELDATTWSNTASIDGLDPDEVYSITLTANHGDSRFGNARFTRVTLNGAPTYQNASTAGVVAYAPNSVSFNTGYNTQRGYVARWINVSPGADGRISVSSQWDSSRGSGTSNNRGYAMSALLLEH